MLSEIFKLFHNCHGVISQRKKTHAFSSTKTVCLFTVWGSWWRSPQCRRVKNQEQLVHLGSQLCKLVFLHLSCYKYTTRGEDTEAIPMLLKKLKALLPTLKKKNFFLQAKQEKEGGREGGKVSLNIRNLIGARLVNKEHPGLYNTCQKLNKQTNNPNLTLPFIFFLSLILVLVPSEIKALSLAEVTAICRWTPVGSRSPAWEPLFLGGV